MRGLAQPFLPPTMSSPKEKPYIERAIAAVKDSTLTPAAVADRIAEECTKATEAGGSGTPDEDFLGLSGFLWNFWFAFFDVAQDDSTQHERLADVLVALQAKGSDGHDDWTVWGMPFSWKDLSFFGPTSREEMNGM